MLPDFPPRIFPNRLPEPERNTAHLINSALLSLQGYVDDFRSAVRLYDFCRVQEATKQLTGASNLPKQFLKELPRWPFLAGRDGAMTIYHFSIALEGLQTNIAKCPTLTPYVERPLLKSANKLLRKYFPDLEQIRHSVAHTADKMKTPEKHAEHSFSGSYSGLGIAIKKSTQVTIINSFQDRLFTNTWEGKVLSYELSQDTWKKLIAIKKEVWAAFKLSEALNAKPPEHGGQRP